MAFGVSGYFFGAETEAFGYGFSETKLYNHKCPLGSGYEKYVRRGKDPFLQYKTSKYCLRVQKMGAVQNENVSVGIISEEILCFKCV